ncbi:MAG: PBP1A family penicillin-binding protein [Gracilibacteraceae bacterium]|jgi:penicillin-binding protein 1A|nr:PBP1A family penicillin-binding protein [Gracilibacteraceae bacterium]
MKALDNTMDSSREPEKAAGSGLEDILTDIKIIEKNLEAKPKLDDKDNSADQDNTLLEDILNAGTLDKTVRIDVNADGASVHKPAAPETSAADANIIENLLNADDGNDEPVDEFVSAFQSRLLASRMAESARKMSADTPSDPTAGKIGKTAKSDKTVVSGLFKGSGGGPPGGKKPTAKKKHYILQRMFLVTFIMFFLACLGAGAFVWATVQDTPEWDPSKLENHKYASFLYDKEGNKIAQLSAPDGNRLPVKYDELPDLLRETLLVVEDKHFYDHLGFDPVRIVKGAVNTARNPGKPEGGSTLTVQLAKDTFIDFEDRLVQTGMDGVRRKLQEIVLSLQIERNYTKEDILTTYFTQIFFGHGAYGVRSAAEIYFGKSDLNDLTPPEIAMLCGLPQAPGEYDPYYKPENAVIRRDLVLSVMRDSGLITREEYEVYTVEPFTFIEDIKDSLDDINRGPGQMKDFPYFVDYVVGCLLDQNKYGLTYDQIYSGGLHIYTTVDPKVQATAEQVMADPANFPVNARDGVPVQGAFVMLDNATGDVIAMVGGRQYTKQLCYNRAAEGMRQVGSTCKPLIVYAPAIETGRFDANTVLVDEPITIGNWSPKNAGGGHRGPMTMRAAIAASVNIYAVKLYMAAGPEHCYNFALNLGIDLTANPNSHYSNLSNSLGAFESTTLQMARAYSAFPNAGMLNEIRCVTKVVDLNGKVLMAPPPQSRRVMQAMTAYAMDELLRGVVTGGTGTRAAIGGWYICGKTGTTNFDAATHGISSGNPDAWFVGFSPYYTAAVWIGFDELDVKNGHYLHSEYGGTRPAMIWNKIMSVALEDFPVQSQPSWQLEGVSIPKKNSVWPDGYGPDGKKIEPEPEDE